MNRSKIVGSIMRVVVRNVFAWVVVCASLTAGNAQSASIAEDLTATQIEQIKAGEQVNILENISGHTWPQVSVYKLVHATPAAVMAVFIDYNSAKDYIPSVLESKVSKHISAHVQEVDYTINVPLLPDEQYCVRNSCSRFGKGGWRVEWTMLRSRYVKGGHGNFTVEPFEGQTLLRHRNLTFVGSSALAPLKNQALSQVSATVNAIANQVKKLKATAPAHLTALEKKLP